MAKLKRNYIQLVTDVVDDEPVFKTYYTPAFIPFQQVYEAMDIMETAESGEKSDRELFKDFAVFIAEEIYKKQFTVEELLNGLHAPDAIRVLREQVEFVAQGNQSDETKKFLQEKNL
ncbi:conserved hypothetical protein [Bacillus sp. 349Y]|nr:conserved hypothetical protein [Bacillus sp. 349Y]